MKSIHILFLYCGLCLYSIIGFSQVPVLIENNLSQGLLFQSNVGIAHIIVPYNDANLLFGDVRMRLENGTIISSNIREIDEKNNLAIYKLTYPLDIKEKQEIDKSQNGELLIYLNSQGQKEYRNIKLKGKNEIVEFDKSIPKEKLSIFIGSQVYSEGKRVGIVSQIKNNRGIILPNQILTNVTRGFFKEKIKKLRIDNSKINKLLFNWFHFYIKCGGTKCKINSSQLRKNNDVVKYLYYGSSRNNLKSRIDVAKVLESDSNYLEIKTLNKRNIFFQIEALNGYKTNIMQKVLVHQSVDNGDLGVNFRGLIECFRVTNTDILRRFKKKLSKEIELPCIICRSASSKSWANITGMFYKSNISNDFEYVEISENDYKSKTRNVNWVKDFGIDVKYLSFKFKHKSNNISPIIIENLK